MMTTKTMPRVCGFFYSDSRFHRGFNRERLRNIRTFQGGNCAAHRLAPVLDRRDEMKKIPTVFERDWNGDRSRVLDRINPAAQWVFDGEGLPTQKLDGTSCMVRDLKLFKRRELRDSEVADQGYPDGFELAERDGETAKVVGWVPVGTGPEDRWHNEALRTAEQEGAALSDGTYELVGPKVQGNPEQERLHRLVAHDHRLVIGADFDRTFNGMRDFLAGNDMEGMVFHHPDGRMAKIKGRDFGLKRPKH